MPGAAEDTTQPVVDVKAAEPSTPAVTPDTAKMAEIEAQLAKVLKHNQELAADNAKYRKRSDEEMEKAKQAGDYAKLLEAERERAAALEAQAKALEPEAVIGRTILQKAQKEVEKARADATLPEWFRATLAGLTPIAALDALQGYRATQSTPPPVATPIGAASATNQAPKGLAGMTEAEILKSPPEQLNELLGRKKNGSHGIMASFFGK